jgi:hypothetical protein
VATGVKRAHVAAAVVAMPCFVASWRSAALLCVGTLYPILLAANACSDDKAAADRKNLLLYFVLASVWKSNLRRFRPESTRRPSRHRRDACSMAWRCRIFTARRSQRGHVIAET